MNLIQKFGPVFAHKTKAWIPLVLWLALWLSISPGRAQNAFHPEAFTDFVHGIRALLPFVAGGISVIALVIMVLKRKTDSSLFAGPLGFAFIYAAVGLLSTLLSPDKSRSLYWVGSYISVPLVLWAITNGTGTLEKVRRIVDITWLIMVLMAMALLAYAFLKLDLADAILHPTVLERCKFGPAWFTNTSGFLRSTGVGRYAAIAALAAIAGIASGSWRTIWAMVFLAALLLLISSGARGAAMAFAGSSVLMVLLYGSRKAIILGLSAVFVVVSVLVITGPGDTIMRHCLGINYLSDAPQQVDSIASDTAVGTVRTDGPVGPVGPVDPINPVGLVESTAGPLVSFSGRTVVWRQSLGIIKSSPLLGRGFHADRIMLDAHVHNTFIHSLLQTGALGTLPLVVGIMLAWFLLFKAIRHLRRFSSKHRTRIVLAGGMLAFFSIRSIVESSGAFFGIDWLILAPTLLYLSMVNNSDEAKIGEKPAG